MKLAVNLIHYFLPPELTDVSVLAYMCLELQYTAAVFNISLNCKKKSPEILTAVEKMSWMSVHSVSEFMNNKAFVKSIIFSFGLNAI